MDFDLQTYWPLHSGKFRMLKFLSKKKIFLKKYVCKKKIYLHKNLLSYGPGRVSSSTVSSIVCISNVSLWNFGQNRLPNRLQDLHNVRKAAQLGIVLRGSVFLNAVSDENAVLQRVDATLLRKRLCFSADCLRVSLCECAHVKIGTSWQCKQQQMPFLLPQLSTGFLLYHNTIWRNTAPLPSSQMVFPWTIPLLFKAEPISVCVNGGPHMLVIMKERLLQETQAFN